jgi:hypothetical protein
MRLYILAGVLCLLGVKCLAGGGHRYFVKTVEEANGLRLAPGDSVFFRGGQRFAGTVKISGVMGLRGRPVWLGSYGGGGLGGGMRGGDD